MNKRRKNENINRDIRKHNADIMKSDTFSEKLTAPI